MDIVRGFTKVSVNRQKHILLHHTFDDVFRRTNDVKILMSTFDFGEHHFVDVKHLVDDLNVFTRLFFIPFGKLGQHVFIDVVSPVIDFQYLASFFLRTLATPQCKEGKDKGKQIFHFFFLFARYKVVKSSTGRSNFLLKDYSCFCFSARLLMTIKRTSTVTKIMVESGLNSGVNPPFRASA